MPPHSEKQRVYDRAYYLANRERIQARHRAWKAANRERVREADLVWQRANRDRVREYTRKWQAANPEQVLASRHAWNKANSDKSRVSTARYRARRHAACGDVPVTNALIDSLLVEPCVYCGSTEYVEIDHVVPLARGGKHEPENLAPACRSCNRSKGAKLLSEWPGGVA